MTSPTFSQAADTSADILARYATDTVDLKKLYVSTGFSSAERGSLTVGETFLLIVREETFLGERRTRIYADRVDRVRPPHHLLRDSRELGYQWGDEDAPADDELDLRFTYIGPYEYVGADLDDSLEITMHFRRGGAEVSA